MGSDENPLKKVEKEFKKSFKKGAEGSIITGGLPGGHAAKGERWVGRKLFGAEGKAEELQKYTLGSGTKRQAEKDIAAGKAYIDPEEPTFEPDPRIAIEREEEEARRRARRFGRSMLITSRSSKLGA